MNDARPPDEDPANDTQRAVPPPTPLEHTLVRLAIDRRVVPTLARQVARQFPRQVNPHGLQTVGDLENIGMMALYHVAREYREDYNDFPAFARGRVRGAMLDAITELFYQERLKFLAIQAENRFCTFFNDTTYNVMKHDEEEVRRRYLDFANGVLAATFAATVDEAQSLTDHGSELGEREDYARAMVVLQKAIGRLDTQEREIFLLLYHQRLDLKAACARLNLPYGQAKVRHLRTLKRFHDLLHHNGIPQMPRPNSELPVPLPKDFFARAPPPTTPGPPTPNPRTPSPFVPTPFRTPGPEKGR